jgi:hypothetical protein
MFISVEAVMVLFNILSRHLYKSWGMSRQRLGTFQMAIQPHCWWNSSDWRHFMCCITNDLQTRFLSLFGPWNFNTPLLVFRYKLRKITVSHTLTQSLFCGLKSHIRKYLMDAVAMKRNTTWSTEHTVDHRKPCLRYGALFFFVHYFENKF